MSEKKHEMSDDEPMGFDDGFADGGHDDDDGDIRLFPEIVDADYDDDDEWDFDAADEFTRQSTNINALIVWLGELPLPVLKVLKSSISNNKADSIWWGRVLLRVADCKIDWNPILGYYAISRISAEAKKVLNSAKFIPASVPKEEREEYLRDICEKSGLASCTVNDRPGPGYTVDVDISKFRGVVVTQKMMNKNLLFSLSHNVKAHSTTDADGFKVKDAKSSSMCPFAEQPYEADNRASPSLYVAKRSGGFTNMIAAFHLQTIDDALVVDTKSMKNYVLYENPPMKNVYVSKTALDPITGWITFIPKKNDFKPDPWCAGFCKRVPFDGCYPVKNHQVIASVLDVLCVSGQSIGGKYSATVSDWAVGMHNSFSWASLGVHRMPPVCLSRQNHKILYLDIMDQVKECDILLTPANNNVTEADKRAYAVVISVFDKFGLDKMLSYTHNEPRAVFMSLGPTPFFWFVKDKAATMVDVIPQKSIIRRGPMIARRLAARNVERYLRGEPMLFLYRVLAVASKNTVELKVLPHHCDLLSYRWVPTEGKSGGPNRDDETDFAD